MGTKDNSLVIGIHCSNPFTKTLTSSGGHLDLVRIKIWVRDILGSDCFHYRHWNVVLKTDKVVIRDNVASSLKLYTKQMSACTYVCFYYEKFLTKRFRTMQWCTGNNLFSLFLWSIIQNNYNIGLYSCDVFKIGNFIFFF